MDSDHSAESQELPLIEIIRDPEVAATVLKPPRPLILSALREPDSASGLAVRLGQPRQRLSHHVRALEDSGLVRLVKERRRRGCTERVMQATARRYLLSPELLGELGDVEAAELSRLGHFGWLPLAAVAGQTLRDLSVLRHHLDSEVPALTVAAHIRFRSPAALADFVAELTDTVEHLLAKYHDEDVTTRGHRFFLGAYPSVPAD